MKISVVRIGNSRGIRIPKTILDQCQLGDTVELGVRNGQLVVKPAARPRAGWEEAFRQMARQGDDKLLDRESLSATQWDRTEWKW
ncbi:MAG TPA: AbrB/MazE/SpoVT family DNA-binding domain-containing protein [Candidatus Binatia bacterium]